MGANPKVEFLLRLGDSDLVLAQRLSEWVGKGPILEEDIALANVGLDLLGQARLWLTYAGEVEGAGRDEDALAYRRDAHQFRNALLCEQPNGNYADTMARQSPEDLRRYATSYILGKPRVVAVILPAEARAALKLTPADLLARRVRP